VLLRCEVNRDLHCFFIFRSGLAAMSGGLALLAPFGGFRLYPEPSICDLLKLECAQLGNGFTPLRYGGLADAKRLSDSFLSAKVSDNIGGFHGRHRRKYNFSYRVG